MSAAGDASLVVSDDSAQMLIVHPDLLLSITEIGEPCSRRAILSNKYKSVCSINNWYYFYKYLPMDKTIHH